MDGMDAVLPHAGGTLAVAAVKPSTYGPGAYDSDVEFVGASLRRLRPVAIALEMCRFRAEWYLVQELGVEALREVKRLHPAEGAFEAGFREALCCRGSAAAGATEEEVAADLRPRAASVPAAGARRAELAAVRSYLGEEPDTELWLIDRDARLNQPRVEAWAGAEGALSAAMGSSAPALATDGRGRTRTTQAAAMQAPANDRLRKRVLAQEREEYMVGELHRRLELRAASAGPGGYDGVVLLLLGATHLEGLIRGWFSPPQADRMRELNDDQGLGMLQSADVLEMALRVRTSWPEVLDACDFYAASFGDSEAATALESLADCCRGDRAAAAELVASPRFAALRGRGAALPPGEDGDRAAAALRELGSWAA